MTAVGPRFGPHAGLLGAAALLVVSLAGCFGPSIPDLSRSLDSLHPPSNWRLAATRTYGPGGDLDCNAFNAGCPSVSRFYVATGTARATYDSAAQMLANAGYSLDRNDSSACAPTAIGAVCSVQARHGESRVLLGVYDAGFAFPDVQIPDPSGPIIMVKAFTV